MGFGDDDLPVGDFPASDPRYADFSAEDANIIRKVWRYTVTSPERIHALIEAITHIVGNEIPGDIVECGVWRGGSMMACALTLLRGGHEDRTLWLYDTFAGMTKPGTADVQFDGTSAEIEFERRRLSDVSSTWAAATLDDVRSNILGTGYPEANIRFIEGPVEQTIPAASPERIALLRLDTDWYESTRHELEHLYPRLVSGGVMIIDDYGHWRGSGKATDEYLASLTPFPFLHRIDYSARLVIKR